MIVSWGRIVVFELHLVTVYGGGGGPSVCVGRKTSDIVEGMDTSNDGGETEVKMMLHLGQSQVCI